VLASCGSQLRTAQRGSHPSNAPDAVLVEYPPPPAQQELIESDPGEPCVWEDGYWTWLGRRWSWQPGRWVLPPTDCYYAEPVMSWVETMDKGVLYYKPPRWYPNDAEELTKEQLLVSCQPVRPCSEQTRSR
jgi:hypothetical protein